jgi:hypothetical protein
VIAKLRRVVSASLHDEPRRLDGLAVGAVALVLRLVVVVWASGRFPPAEDGRYYQTVAERIARGLGYTWLWPDGAVTYAAHYPVGYPGMLGGLYALFGAEPLVAMLAQAMLGAMGTYAVHRTLSKRTSRAGALVAAAFFGLHPGLVLYTPALMTEGVASAMVAMLGLVATLASERAGGRHLLWLVLLGLGLGLLTLVRPQMLLVAPFVALAARTPSEPRLRAAARRGPGWLWDLGAVVLVGLTAVTTCLPWTLRNCERMGRCTFVSANAGWNLLIGTSAEGRGGWVPAERAGIPEECRTVFAEAEKDACFGRGAARRIAARPGSWLRLVPDKLGQTFDYTGAAGYYLHSSNPSAFGQEKKLALGGVELVWERAMLALGLVGLARLRGPRHLARKIASAVSGFFLLGRSAWLSHLGLLVTALLLGRGLLRSRPALLAVGAVGTTALAHAVFFGAGRYSLVCVPWLAVLAGAALPRRGASSDQAG